MAKIVVLGAGLGGIIAAYEIRKAVRRQDEVVAINETDFYQFVPSNPWVIVGWRERKDGETTVHDGVFTPFDVSHADAENMVMAARLKAGWVTEEDLAADAEKLAEFERLEASGVAVARERGRGWRRLVASPRPLEIDDVDTIRWLLRRPTLVVAAGGGGVPVVRRRGGRLEGVPAVVDKDLASMVLARGISARHLVILTGVRAVYRDFATPRARAIRRLSIDEALALADAGHFPEGSMGPKIEAAIGFLCEGGRSVTITDADHLAAALRGRDGTTLTRTGRAPKEADA